MHRKQQTKTCLKAGQISHFSAGTVWLALFIALAGLATSSCKAVASGLAVGEGLIRLIFNPYLVPERWDWLIGKLRQEEVSFPIWHQNS